MTSRRLLTVGALAIAVVAACAATVLPARATPAASVLEPGSLEQARAIRDRLDARYRAVPRGGLAVTEAVSTGVVGSFALLTPDLRETRVHPAGNGVWYAICPVGAHCPYPATRLARPAAELAPRRLALELALHTFLETSADLVAVGLPTPRFVAFVVAREELVREVDLHALARALGGDPARTLSASLRAVVERVTRPRVFVAMGLERSPNGLDVWAGLPRWPGPAR